MAMASSSLSWVGKRNPRHSSNWFVAGLTLDWEKDEEDDKNFKELVLGPVLKSESMALELKDAITQFKIKSIGSYEFVWKEELSGLAKCLQYQGLLTVDGSPIKMLVQYVKFLNSPEQRKNGCLDGKKILEIIQPVGERIFLLRKAMKEIMSKMKLVRTCVENEAYNVMELNLLEDPQNQIALLQEKRNNAAANPKEEVNVSAPRAQPQKKFKYVRNLFPRLRKLMGPLLGETNEAKMAQEQIRNLKYWSRIKGMSKATHNSLGHTPRNIGVKQDKSGLSDLRDFCRILHAMLRQVVIEVSQMYGVLYGSPSEKEGIDDKKGIIKMCQELRALLPDVLYIEESVVEVLCLKHAMNGLKLENRECIERVKDLKHAINRDSDRFTKLWKICLGMSPSVGQRNETSNEVN